MVSVWIRLDSVRIRLIGIGIRLVSVWIRLFDIGIRLVSVWIRLGLIMSAVVRESLQFSGVAVRLAVIVIRRKVGRFGCISVFREKRLRNETFCVDIKIFNVLRKHLVKKKLLQAICFETISNSQVYFVGTDCMELLRLNQKIDDTLVKQAPASSNRFGFF